MAKARKVAILLFVCAAAICLTALVMFVPQCSTVNPTGISYLTPDSRWSITVYVKSCTRRFPGSDTHKYWVLVARPSSEPAPQSLKYREAEVVFEVEEGERPPQVGITNPAAMGQFSDLNDYERQHSMLVMCSVHCPLPNIRKQVGFFNGTRVHYFQQEDATAKALIR